MKKLAAFIGIVGAGLILAGWALFTWFRRIREDDSFDNAHGSRPRVGPEVYRIVERDVAARRRHGTPLPMGYIVHPRDLIEDGYLHVKEGPW